MSSKRTISFQILPTKHIHISDLLLLLITIMINIMSSYLSTTVPDLPEDVLTRVGRGGLSAAGRSIIIFHHLSGL
jgi:hypothetical protein